MPRLLTLLLACAFVAGQAAAQGRPALTVDTQGDRRVSLRLDGLFADPELQEVVESGLPLRVRVRVELWRDRIVDRAQRFGFLERPAHV